jgi:hypothetical protein
MCLFNCLKSFFNSICITNGIAADCKLAIPLLKKARYWLRKTGYVLADKDYDWGFSQLDCEKPSCQSRNINQETQVREKLQLGSCNRKLSVESERENTQEKYIQQTKCNRMSLSA